MNIWMKRVLVVVLAVLMGLSSLLATTQAADAAEGNDTTPAIDEGVKDDIPPPPHMDIEHLSHFEWAEALDLLDPAVARAHKKAHEKGGEYQQVFDDTYMSCMDAADDSSSKTQRKCMRQARRAARQATGFTEDGMLPDGVPGGDPIVQPVVP